MDDIELSLRSAYFNVLNNIVVDGLKIPMYDSAPFQEVNSPYIVWEDARQREDGTKSGFATDVDVMLVIYDFYDGNFGGSARIDKISNKIMNTLMPSKGVFGISISGLDINKLSLHSSYKNFTNRDGKRIYMKVLTIEHLIFQ